jgi:type I restriction enzyme S subunit
MLLSNLNILATAPGGVAKLRELILTLAMQGKLVPQDPKDEPASELLKKIRAEKDRLVAEGKIKRAKPLAEITADEKPFELPAGWEWARLDDVSIAIVDCPHSTAKFVSTGLLCIDTNSFKNGKLVPHKLRYVEEATFADRIARLQPQPGDLVFAREGSVGESVIIPDGVNACLGQRVMLFRFSKRVSNEFVRMTISSKAFVDKLLALHKGIGAKHVNVGDMRLALVPLPPLAEQSRIVTRVEELMRLCDALEAKGQLEATQHAQLVSTLLVTLTASETPEELADNWQRVATHFGLLLDRPEAVDALEQTILQLAVRGLLVPQDPQDEPASELLKKIRVEKDRLIAEGKIKRDKPLPPIAVDEQPFNLPAGWAWARFPELGEFGRGKSKHRPRNDPSLFDPPKYPLIQTGEVSRAKGVVKEAHSYYSDLGLAQSRLWPKGTLCITIAANIAESAILGFDSCFPDSVVGFVPADAMGNVEYFLQFVETAKANLLAFAPATAQKNINLEILSSLLIPLPPLTELTRIVARVASLRALCADLRQRLADLQSVQARLAEELVASVAA